MNNGIQEHKNSAVYFYKKGRVPFVYKAISNLKIIEKEYIFLSHPKPSKKVIAEYALDHTLPAIRGTLAASSEDQEGLQQFQYGGSVTNFDEIIKNLLMVAHKEDQYNKEKEERKKAYPK